MKRISWCSRELICSLYFWPHKHICIWPTLQKTHIFISYVSSPNKSIHLNIKWENKIKHVPRKYVLSIKITNLFQPAHFSVLKEEFLQYLPIRLYFPPVSLKFLVYYCIVFQSVLDCFWLGGLPSLLLIPACSKSRELSLRREKKRSEVGHLP